VDVFDFRMPSVSQEDPKVGAQANDEGGARNQYPRYLLTGMTSEREAKPRRGGAGHSDLGRVAGRNWERLGLRRGQQAPGFSGPHFFCCLVQRVESRPA
jgi:hypothetical protein